MNFIAIKSKLYNFGVLCAKHIDTMWECRKVIEVLYVISIYDIRAIIILYAIHFFITCTWKQKRGHSNKGNRAPTKLTLSIHDHIFQWYKFALDTCTPWGPIFHFHMVSFSNPCHNNYICFIGRNLDSRNYNVRGFTRHSEYIIHKSRLYFMSFPDSHSLYRSIHTYHASPF